jgi:hypothetical protein
LDAMLMRMFFELQPIGNIKVWQQKEEINGW